MAGNLEQMGNIYTKLEALNLLAIVVSNWNLRESLKLVKA